jgi:MFS transporter, SET family, sugar efflux transporter
VLGRTSAPSRLRPDSQPRSDGRAHAAWRTILAVPFLRAAFVALFVSGIAVSATTPQLTLFLVGDLGASVPVAGLYYLVNIAAPVAGYWLGSLSDRQNDRLVLYRICAVVGGVGWLLMALADQIWMPFAIGAFALSIAGGSMGQLFAAARDDLSRRQTPGADRVIATLRMAFTAGWVIGPVLGSWFGAVYGLRPLLLATAVLTVGQIAPLGRLRVPRYTAPARRGANRAQPTASSARPVPSRVPLFVFVGCCVLVMNGDTIKFAYLPLYMANQLDVSDTVRGAVIAVQPLAEFMLMPVFARLADRFTPIRMVTVGAVFGVAANLAYGLSGHVVGLFVGQLLMSALWAALAGLGVSVAQQLYPEGVGLASTVFMSSIMFAGGLGGALGGLGTALLGVPHVFFLSAAVSSLGVAGLLLTERWFRPSQAVFESVPG